MIALLRSPKHCVVGFHWDRHAVTCQAVPVARICDAQTQTQEVTKGVQNCKYENFKIYDYDDPYQDTEQLQVLQALRINVHQLLKSGSL